MIVVVKSGVPKEKFDGLLQLIEKCNVTVNISAGDKFTAIGLFRDVSSIDKEMLATQETVESVDRINEPYKRANRKMHPQNTSIKIKDNLIIGSQQFARMAGPCAVESEKQIIEVAHRVQLTGANLLRGNCV